MFRISHKSVLMGFAVTFALAAIGSWMTGLRLRDVGLTFTVLAVLFGLFCPVPAYWHEKGDVQRRDSALLIPYAFMIIFFASVPFLVGARLGFPLQDWRFARIDQALGVNTGAIVQWTHRHGLFYGSVLVYNSLIYCLLAAVIVPALLGKFEGRRFLVGNVLALAIGIPCCAFLPAIGPWYSEQFPATGSQLALQQQIVALRATGPYTFSVLGDAAGIVAFPSFHVIWAILAASALWAFRTLRVPLVLWSLLLIVTTLTTGFHYFVDVLAGIAVAAAALVGAERLLRTRPLTPNETDSGHELSGDWRTFL